MHFELINDDTPSVKIQYALMFDYQITFRRQSIKPSHDLMVECRSHIFGTWIVLTVPVDALAAYGAKPPTGKLITTIRTYLLEIILLSMHSYIIRSIQNESQEGSESQMLYFSEFSPLSKQRYFIGYHAHVWQISPQPFCGDTRRVWKQFKEQYFCKIKNFLNVEIYERSFSKPDFWSIFHLFNVACALYISTRV